MRKWSRPAPGAITDTSPLVYLHRAGALHWLDAIFDSVRLPGAVVMELRDEVRRGYDVPVPGTLPWLRIVEPDHVPSQWLTLDLGAGELAAMALVLEHPSRTILLDDQLARRTARAAGLDLWGTLRVILEAKVRGPTPKSRP